MSMAAMKQGTLYPPMSMLMKKQGNSYPSANQGILYPPVNQGAPPPVFPSQPLSSIGMTEEERFAGDISKYHRFRIRYNGLMRNVVDAQTKLDYLLMWTKGKAYRTIEKCVFNENHEAALQKALTTLDERYGDPSQVANQTVEDIIGGRR